MEPATNEKRAGGTAVELTELPAGTTRPLEKVYAFWLAGMSCDGCTISVSGATDPSVEDLLLGTIPGLPRVVLYHPVLAGEAGEDFMRNFDLAAEGKLDAPYVMILEGSATDDSLIEGKGFWSGMGSRMRDDPDDPDAAEMVSVMEWIDRMAPGAAASIAIGTCATWGGIPAAAGNPTGAMSLSDYLGPDYRSAFGLPVINIPGCAPVGDNFTEVVAMVLQFLQGTGPLPEFDHIGRPAWQFHDTVHDRCVRGGFYEEGKFAKEYGDPECLVEVGCWGPVVQCNIVERGAINGHGGCMNQGGICIGCTMPGFPDKFTPFYKAAPGGIFSTTASRGVGKVVRFLRQLTRNSLNREKYWDEIGETSSGWGPDRDELAVHEKVSHYFYEIWQRWGSVKPGEWQEDGRYRGDYRAGTVRRNAENPDWHEGEMKWGFARRRERVKEQQEGRREGHDQ